MKEVVRAIFWLVMLVCTLLAGMSLAFIGCEQWGGCDPADLPHKPATSDGNRS